MTTQQEIQYQIKKLKDVITHCKSRERANEIQDEIDTLEGQLNDSCPSCGSYEVNQYDDLTCGDEYHKSELERHYPGDPSVRTTSMYWDCECKENYIHQKNVAICEKCEADQDNQPDSRVSEVNEFLNGANANSKWSEIKSDYTDDNGVTSIDAFLTPDDNEDGKSIALIVNGEVYYKNYDAVTDEYAQRVIKEACKESKQIARGKELVRELAFDALSNLIDRDLIKDTDGDHYLQCLDAIRLSKIDNEPTPPPRPMTEDESFTIEESRLSFKVRQLLSALDYGELNKYQRQVVEQLDEEVKKQPKTTTNRDKAEAVRSYLIELAIDDKLPLDMNELQAFDLEQVISNSGRTTQPQAEIICTDDGAPLYAILDKEKDEFVEKDFHTAIEAIDYAKDLGYEITGEEW